MMGVDGHGGPPLRLNGNSNRLIEVAGLDRCRRSLDRATQHTANRFALGEDTPTKVGDTGAIRFTVLKVAAQRANYSNYKDLRITTTPSCSAAGTKPNFSYSLVGPLKS